MSDFNETSGFLDRFSENTQVLFVTKIRLAGAELFLAEGRRDGHHEANSRFQQFSHRIFVKETLVPATGVAPAVSNVTVVCGGKNEGSEQQRFSLTEVVHFSTFPT